MTFFVPKVPRVLVLGGSGLLGTALVKQLNDDGCDVITTTRRAINAPVRQLRFNVISEAQNRHRLRRLDIPTSFDYVINCIGFVKQKFDADNIAANTQAHVINHLFPQLLADWSVESDTRVIHISTDCVFSGKRELNAPGYTEASPLDYDDEYGMTKALGEARSCPNVMTTRQTFVGIPPDINRAYGLIAWLLKRFAGDPGKPVPGFIDHMWNGLTAPQLAKMYSDIVMEDLWMQGVVHLHSHNVITKYDVLKCYRDALGRNDICIDEVNASSVGMCAENRTLASDMSWYINQFDVPTLQTMVHDDIDRSNIEL